MLRNISYVDLANFAGVRNAKDQKRWKFEGNIEDQALLLHVKALKKELGEARVYSDEEDLA